MTGKLLKMKLVGFRDSTYLIPTGFFCEVQVNPESYSLDHSVQLAPADAQGSPGGAATFGQLKPRKLSFEVVFDATGALTDDAALPVFDKAVRSGAGIWPQLTAFKDTVYTYFGESHRSPFVLVQWGSLVFPCQLESLNITYKLFSPQGVPLRATAKVALQEAIDDKKLAFLANALSADLTHIRTVKAGDTLPHLCYQVYGDASLYVKVAAANGLLNFRHLRVGEQLAFPPLVPAETDDE
jgi:phage tail protein X